MKNGIFFACCAFSFLLFIVSIEARTTIINRPYSRGSYLSRGLNSKMLYHLFSKGNSSSNGKTRVKLEMKEWTYIIAPHPDDEVLCCAETISEKIKQNIPTKVVYITNGDALSRENNIASVSYGERRRKESLGALKKLGIPKNDAIFLNFPDGELHRLNTKNAIVSGFTGKRMSENKSFFPFSPYTYQGLQKNMEDLFLKYPPKEVFIPSSLDTHPDHKISGKIVQKALKTIKKYPDVFGYTIHGNVSKKIFQVNHWKKSLISLFTSQFHNSFHKKYLLNFAKNAESFIRIQGS